MPYDKELAARVREVLQEHGDIGERKMFGGIAFMVGAHMCCGVLHDDLVLRLGSDRADKALQEEHVRPMDFTGRPMKGYVFVGPAGVRGETALRRRLRSALDFVSTLPTK
jgi:hypothetical protein